MATPLNVVAGSIAASTAGNKPRRGRRSQPVTPVEQAVEQTVGTAVMEAPAAPGVDVDAKAAVAGVDAAEVSVLDNIAATGVNVRSSEVSKAERTIAVLSAVKVCIGVGLGEKAEGYGPFVRQAILRLLKKSLGRPVKIEDITSDAIEAIISADNFKVDAVAEIRGYGEDLVKADAKRVADGKAPTGELMLARRVTDSKRATDWVNLDLWMNYRTALQVIKHLGGRVKFGTEIDLSLNRALAVAYGRNITAGELVKAATTKGVHFA